MFWCTARESDLILKEACVSLPSVWFQKVKLEGGHNYVQLSACPCPNSPQRDGVAGVLKGCKWLGLTSSARFEGMLLTAMCEIFNVDTGKFEAFSSGDRKTRHAVFVGSRTISRVMSSHPIKRQRLDNRLVAEGASRHEFVPFESDGFRNVYAREGRLTRLGPSLATAPSGRLTQKSDEQWKVVASWLPLDDPEFALDPDGAWYDEVVEGDVMAEENAAPSALKKKRAKSRVSVSDHVSLVFFPYVNLRAVTS